MLLLKVARVMLRGGERKGSSSKGLSPEEDATEEG